MQAQKTNYRLGKHLLCHEKANIQEHFAKLSIAQELRYAYKYKILEKNQNTHKL